MEETRNASPYCNWEDIISRLPDSLIHHIMSYNDTKYAVQTSVLSKRWIHVWKSLPCLKFDRWSFSEDKTKRFIEFVYMVFLLRDDSNIQKFSVHWQDSAFDEAVTTNVNRWSLHATKYNAQEISIVIEQLHNSAYEIPHRLLNCKSLRKLEIKVFETDRFADIILPRSMDLPHLRDLSLDGLSISNIELSKRLFSGCPVLETLEITDCDIQTDNQRNLIVNSASLKKFVYVCWDRDLLLRNDTVAIKLCAPNLEEFYCKSFLTHKYSLENCSPLSDVCFEIYLEANEEDENAEMYSVVLPSEEKDAYAQHMMKFLRAVYMVRDLSLSSMFLEVLSRAPDLLHCQPPRLHNLKHLKLEMWSTRGCIRAIAYLLGISPNIEEIYLRLKESNLVDIGDDWEAGLSLPGMLSNLKYIQIEELEGCDAELKLLSFLFKNAKVLEGVALCFCTNVDSCGKKSREGFKNKLRALPTASSNIKMILV